MGLTDYFELLRQKSGLTKHDLGKELGLKSRSHIWLLESGKRLPSFPTCYKIIEFAKKYDVHLTLDMLRGNPISGQSERLEGNN